MSYKSFFVLLLFAASLFLTVGALSGELKVKLDATIRNKVFEAIKSSVRSIYHTWHYNIDYDDIWLRNTRYGEVWVYDISPSPTMTVSGSTVTVHYPYLTYVWYFKYYSSTLWIDYYLGHCENRYTIKDIKLTFRGLQLPTVTHSGKLSNFQLPYFDQFDYSSVSWSYYHGLSKPYGSRLFEGDGKNIIINSIVYYIQYSTSWPEQFRSIENEVNRYIQYNLPAIKKQNPIIKSSDTEVSKKLNDLYKTVTGFVEMYSSGIPYCFNVLLNYQGKDMSTRSPYYDIELRLRDIPFVKNTTWSNEQQKQALERLKNNTEFNRAFIDGINHFGKNITSYRIVNGTSDLISSKTVLHTSLLFDDKFKQKYEDQNYLVLKWNFKIVEVLQDRSRAVAYQGKFRIHTTKNVDELITKNQTTYQIKRYVPVYLEGSVDDIQPYIGEQKTRDAVERFISFMNETIVEFSEAENSDYLQIVVPKHYRITGGKTDWMPKYNNEGKRELDIDFFVYVKEV